MKPMWSCHFRFLTRKDHFLDYFIVILRFDTEIRRRCSVEPNFSLTFDQYRSCFMQVLIQHMNSILTSDKALSHPQRFDQYCYRCFPCASMYVPPPAFSPFVPSSVGVQANTCLMNQMPYNMASERLYTITRQERCVRLKTVL